jgi:hypothetical protein
MPQNVGHLRRIGEAAHRMHARGQCAGRAGSAQFGRGFGAGAVEHDGAGGDAVCQLAAHRPDLVVAYRQQPHVGGAHLAQRVNRCAGAHEIHRRGGAGARAGQHILH